VKQRAKAFRISRRKEIVFLLKNGTRWKCSIFSLAYLESISGHDRAAVIVSKANGNAVRRNGIKRIYRDLFNRNKSVVPPFFDILIMPVGNLLPTPAAIQSNYEAWKSLARQ
jgi:ribonuclease P protein component